jgi:hypothetical protein
MLIIYFYSSSLYSKVQKWNGSIIFGLGAFDQCYCYSKGYL